MSILRKAYPAGSAIPSSRAAILTRQPHDVVAAACADVRDGHPGLDAEETHKLA